VRGVDLRVGPGDVVGLVGESGSGKSITALAVMRLLPPGARITSGIVSFRGRDLVETSDAEMNRLRGGDIGMIFQDPLTALNPAMSIAGSWATPSEPISRLAIALLKTGRRNCSRWSVSRFRRSGCAPTRTNYPVACGSA